MIFPPKLSKTWTWIMEMQSKTSYMALENHDFPTQALRNLNLDYGNAIRNIIHGPWTSLIQYRDTLFG